DTDNTLDLTDDIIDNPDDNIIEEASDTEEVPDIDEETDVEEEPNIEEEPEIVYQSEFRLPGKINQDSTYDTTEDTRDPDGIYYDKKVYLTFDDGPTMHTDDILDILAQYNVKATFFVIGHEDDVSKERYKRIVNEGHVLAIHSYSHKYQDIYKSIENFDKDFTKLWNLLYDTTGYTPTLYRFPGGSLGFLGRSKMKEYVRYLDEKGMTYYDWNVVNGDAEGKNYTEEQMIDNVLNGVARKKTSIVLMHDGEGKHKTVATLPDILDALISGGAEVLPMDETVPLIQQIKASSLK
ncbi:MAG: polysaccharide deacetylase, partial [Clostridiales bacterium]|nr:polysaccharide deacetylase [Clostridiales bacterium]